MTLDGLTVVVVGGFVLQITGLVVMSILLTRDLREITRTARAVAGLVYQEEGKDPSADTGGAGPGTSSLARLS